MRNPACFAPVPALRSIGIARRQRPGRSPTAGGRRHGNGEAPRGLAMTLLTETAWSGVSAWNCETWLHRRMPGAEEARPHDGKTGGLAKHNFLDRGTQRGVTTSPATTLFVKRRILKYAGQQSTVLATAQACRINRRGRGEKGKTRMAHRYKTMRRRPEAASQVGGMSQSFVAVGGHYHKQGIRSNERLQISW